MLSKPVGQVQYFRSRIDDRLQPCAVCATGDGGDPVPLIVEVSPGASAKSIDRAVGLTEQIAGIAARHGERCVVLRPTGRGPGSVYQNYGEVDTLEAIEHVCAAYPIDRDRISITGSSMGGAATWYLASHYPDLFAAAAPFCGYCDYRLWEKPGGLTFHMHEWEEPSWRSRSAALLVGNLRHTPAWIVHGEWDRSVGGGVPVEHSLQMARMLEEQGINHRLTTVPETGHGCRRADIWEEVILWLLAQRKDRSPRRVELATFGLRHDRSNWLGIEQFIRYGQCARADGALEDGRVAVSTDNVQALSVGPLPARDAVPLALDGQEMDPVNASERMAFQRADDGSWQAGRTESGQQKRHGASGPIGDMFFERTVLVPGTAGSKEETFFNGWVARHACSFFSARNGGVHRGGIMGQNSVELPVVADVDLPEEAMREANLILYGTPESNAVLKRFAEQTPLRFDADGIAAAGRTYSAKGAAIFAVFPHPDAPERYVAVHGGTEPDAITWGSHLDMMLLPDYIVYARGELIDWGFRGNDWR